MPLTRKRIEATYMGSPVILALHTHQYTHGGNLAVRLNLCDDKGREEEPFCTLSINVTQAGHLPAGEFILNHDVAADFLEDLERQGLVEKTGRTVSYGYVKDRPVCRLTAKARELDLAERAAGPPPSMAYPP
jgi:hypothetical protein